ncbi:hypothetical protein [Marinobacter sp. JSM 1782161]|uniref:hypothetical protein n=1 Tax=Marinobacter sp. JSM 1782161 TaxID=2685906 RepID=UPI00140255C7|nr:hypothetical protein [Marinobacter sp. JSM 1782161]
MITLNTERGLIKVETWQEIEELPGFTKDIDPKEYELKEIIGRYIFKDYIKCGLSSCHTPHGKGYIVTTKTGPITNIGRNCGRNHFGVEFEELSKTLETEIRIKTYRDTIGSFLIFIDQHKEAVNKLRSGPFGADTVYRKANLLLKNTSGCPEEAVKILSRMVRSRNTDITKDRIASKQEVEDLEAIQGKSLPRPYYIEEKVGYLSGLPFLYKENDLRERLIIDLEEGFKAIEELNLDDASDSELKHWSGWSSEVERKIKESEEILKYGVALLEKANLMKLEKALSDDKSKSEYREFVRKKM